MTSAYVYIATTRGAGTSYADVAGSLLEMEWIKKYGVTDLVWFEGFAEVSLAEARARELREMSEVERRSHFLRHNPDQSDLTPRVWSSDPESP